MSISFVEARRIAYPSGKLIQFLSSIQPSTRQEWKSFGRNVHGNSDGTFEPSQSRSEWRCTNLRIPDIARLQAPQSHPAPGFPQSRAKKKSSHV